MNVFQRSRITDSAPFVAAEYPALDKSLGEIHRALTGEPGVKVAMILSFVKDHCLNSEQARTYPELAHRITTGDLQLQVLEDLFAAAKGNPAFRQHLEAHILHHLTVGTAPASV